MSADEHPERAGVAGGVAIEVARQLAAPVRSLRDRLGLVVDHLERHVATSTGPTPYPWRSLQALRQDLAGAYLEATTLARRLDELDRALDEEPAGWFDLAAAVELGLRLAGHHLTGEQVAGEQVTGEQVTGEQVTPLGDRAADVTQAGLTGERRAASSLEILIDLGHTPPVRGAPGTLALVVAQLVGTSARSARALPGSALSVRTFVESGAGIVLIADNGAGSDRADQLGELARQIVAPWGASIDAASAQGQGCAFELRLVTVPA